MKRMTSLIVMVTTAFLGMSVLAAGVPPVVTPNNVGLPASLPMVMNRAAMVSYQKNMSHRAYMSVYGSRVVEGGTNSLWVYQANPANLLSAVMNQSLNFILTEVGEVGVTLQYQNDLGRPSFLGWRNTYVKTNAAGKVVFMDTTMEVTMVSDPAIMIPSPGENTGLDRVVAKVFDENGNLVNEVTLEAEQQQNGRIVMNYPEALLGDALALAGRTMELHISVRDWSTGQVSTTVYNPTTGEQIKLLNGNFAFSSVTEDVITNLVDNSDVFAVIGTTDGIGQNRVYAVKLTVTKNLTVYGKTSEGKVAKSVLVKLISETGEELDEVTVENGASMNGLGAGQYHVIFNWNEGDLVEPNEFWWQYQYYNWN
jgi:hypothetical protein